MTSPLYFQWAVSNLFGWGVYGLNLLRHWPEVSGAPAYTISKVHLDGLHGMDPLALRALAQPLVDSDQMLHKLTSGMATADDGIVLHSLGNRFLGTVPPSQGGVSGRATFGVIFFEDTDLGDGPDLAKEYRQIITGSTWCEEVLRARGIDNVATVVQGVEPSLFHPAPRAGWLKDRFAIFSGGKLEYRKAQDIVLLAFRAFASRHPEAILVSAWHSPWAAPALTLNGNPAVEHISVTPEGQVNILGWCAANGLSPDQVIDLGPTPNHLMPRVLREMDVALFPNRCEGGTNLVAMECMAVGLPTIVSNNTGHKDLVATGATYSLDRQGPASSSLYQTEGWGESDIDEIVEALESVWADREAAKRRGAAAAEAMAGWSWHTQIGRLRDVIIPASD